MSDKATKGERLILQSLHRLAHIIVWQTRILSEANAKRKVYKGTYTEAKERGHELQLTEDELLENGLNTMERHTQLMEELSEAAFK